MAASSTGFAGLLAPENAVLETISGHSAVPRDPSIPLRPPIARLPTELLQRIFSLVLEELDTGFQRDELLRWNLSLVCKTFRLATVDLAEIDRIVIEGLSSARQAAKEARIDDEWAASITKLTVLTVPRWTTDSESCGELFIQLQHFPNVIDFECLLPKLDKFMVRVRHSFAVLRDLLPEFIRKHFYISSMPWASKLERLNLSLVACGLIDRPEHTLRDKAVQSLLGDLPFLRVLYIDSIEVPLFVNARGPGGYPSHSLCHLYIAAPTSLPNPPALHCILNFLEAASRPIRLSMPGCNFFLFVGEAARLPCPRLYRLDLGNLRIFDDGAFRDRPLSHIVHFTCVSLGFVTPSAVYRFFSLLPNLRHLRVAAVATVTTSTWRLGIRQPIAPLSGPELLLKGLRAKERPLATLAVGREGWDDALREEMRAYCDGVSTRLTWL